MNKLSMLILALVAVLLVGGFIYWYQSKNTTGMNENNGRVGAISDPNAIGTQGYPIIFDAIENRDIDKVRALIKAGANLEAQGFAGGTPALKAASIDAWDICLLLLESGADLTITDRTGMTIPSLAADSRVAPESPIGKDLEAVRGLIKERGLTYLNVPPPEVRKLQAEGKWPPPAPK